MRAAERLLQHLVDQPSFLRSRSAVPPMASAAISFLSVLFHRIEAQLFRRDHRIGAELQHHQPVAHADRERAARAALADHDATMGAASIDISNRLRAMASLWPRSSEPMPG
jgi:hypothetical protein